MRGKNFNVVAQRRSLRRVLWCNKSFCRPSDVTTAARINPLTEGPIARALFFFTLPILASNVLQSLNGSVNAIWVGHYLGEAALTATSNANIILFFLISLVFGVGMAAAILVGQSIGARARSLLAQIVSGAELIGYLHRRRHPLFLHADERRFLRPDRAILRALVKKGLPMGLQMIVLSGSSIVMISLVNRFGSQTTAAFGAAFQLWNYIMMPALAVGMAESAMRAQNVGAKRFDRVHRIAVTGLGFNLLMTGVLVVLIYLFNRGALGLFLPDEGAAIAIAQHINAIVVWSFMLIGIAM